MLLEAVNPPQPAHSKAIAAAKPPNCKCLRVIFTKQYIIVFTVMLAIANSLGITPPGLHEFRLVTTFLKRHRAIWTLICIPWLLCLSNGLQAADSATNSQDAAKFAQQAEKAYTAAKTHYEANPNDAEVAWRFASTCFDWADFSTSDNQREQIANEGIAACRKLLEKDTNSARAHYYLAMNLGQVAQTKMLGALKIVDQMEKEFKIALALDPKMDYAGADRGLGLLYLEAPGWPASIGNRSKARQHLQKALKQFPNYPENLLNMIEAEIKWGAKHDVSRDLLTLDQMWPAAQKEFAGQRWESSWADWARRRELAEKKSATQKASVVPGKSSVN